MFYDTTFQKRLIKELCYVKGCYEPEALIQELVRFYKRSVPFIRNTGIE